MPSDAAHGWSFSLRPLILELATGAAAVSRTLLLTLASIYLALIGLGMTLVPTRFGIGAVPSDATPALLAFLRIFGGPCLGIAVLDWLARRFPPSAARHAILIGNAVGFTVVGLVDVWGLFHEARDLARIFVVIHLAFAVGFIVAVAQERSLVHAGTRASA